MNIGLASFGWVTLLVVGLLILLPADFAAAQSTPPNSSPFVLGVPKPIIPQAAKGLQCIAPTDFMRKNHMKLLSHDRDKTVKLGDREIKASLKDCVACHVVNGADNQPVTYEDPKYFCRVCHDYVAVKVDCFECHASVPGITMKGGLNQKSSEAEALAAYVLGDDKKLKPDKPDKAELKP